MLSAMYPLRLLVCFVLAAAFGQAAESSAKSGASENPSVKVEGLVSKPGTVEFPPQRGLMITDAISLAGGQTRFAELRDVTLTRKQADGTTHVRTIDVNAIMKMGPKGNVALQPGDVIFVPPRY